MQRRNNVTASLHANGPLVALYPGSFDPVHNGHLDLIQRTAGLFDRVIVAIYDKPDKRLLFSTEERVRLVEQTVASLSNIEVASYSCLTVDYAVNRGARAIVRGLRATSDFDFEFQIALMNRYLSTRVEALFLMTSLEHAHLSSSLVKEVSRLGANVDGLVPATVAEALREKQSAANG